MRQAVGYAFNLLGRKFVTVPHYTPRIFSSIAAEACKSEAKAIERATVTRELTAKEYTELDNALEKAEKSHRHESPYY